MEKTIYSLKDIEVIDGDKRYLINQSAELIYPQDNETAFNKALKEVYKVAVSVYRLNDEIFGVKYKVILKSDFTGVTKFFDSHLSEAAFTKYGAYRAKQILREKGLQG